MIGKNLLKKSLGEEIIISFFGASVVPFQSLCFWEENPMNNCGMCDDQDRIKNGQRNLVLGSSKYERGENL